MMLSRFFFVSALFFISTCACAQQPDSLPVSDSTGLADSTKIIQDSTIAIDSLAAKQIADSLQTKDSLANIAAAVALQKKKADSIKTADLLVQKLRKQDSTKDILFYILAMIILLFAILKILYPRYFSNLFRVFFNTSLRQSQLTDQLLQSKLPSLLYNVFFILIGSWYIYLLLNFYDKVNDQSKWPVIGICLLGLSTIYFGKYCILKFTGWVTGYKQEADMYIFIIFLINKIVAICLIPLVILISFSARELANIAVLLSFIVIVMMILMRFFRSYGLLQNRLKVSRLHFFLYIIGIELVPLLVIYKLALIFMSKSL